MNHKEKLDDIVNRYWEWRLKTDPIEATFYGDTRYNHLLPDLSELAVEQQRVDLRRFHQELSLLDKNSLHGEDFITCDVLLLKIGHLLKTLEYKLYEWEVDQIFGPQLQLLSILNFQPLDSNEDIEALLTRYENFSTFINDYISNLKTGLSKDRVAPRIAHERVLEQLKSFINTPIESSPLFNPAKRFPKHAEAFKRHIEGHIYPAFERLYRFLSSDYKSREAVGICNIEGGKTAYEFLAKMNTTTELTPQQIHEIGLADLESIHSEMKKIARTNDLKTFMERLKSDPSNFPKTREELVEGYKTILARCYTKLPLVFGRLPKVKCEVKPIEEYREKDCPAAFYYSPDDNFTRQGIFYANTYKPETRPKYNMTALTVHEAVPGHHQQIAIAMERAELSKFRRHAHFTAFVEGWGLYSERLGDEMGLYENDLSRFGMLTYQAWRACRLVVDTGMHYFNWTRDKAIKFFQDNLLITDTEIIAEINRYIIWPGQALAYKIGQREIERIRKECSAKMGSCFSVKSFHDELLCHGSLPLSTIEKIMSAWSQSAQSS